MTFSQKLMCWALSFVVCWISSVSQGAYSSNLPDLGNSATRILSPLEEQKLGRTILNEIKQSVTLVEDNVIEDYIQTLGARLVGTQPKVDYPFHFFILKEDSINAFALPGGFIGVNTGLIAAAESESELSGVIAHEVAHVTQHHIARITEHMGRVQLSSIAGILAAALIGMKNPEMGSGALATTLAGSTQSLINFTRENEKEADFVGIQSLYRAGFDPYGMPSFFIRMQQATRFYGDYPAYLQTHPLTETRRMEAYERAQTFPFKQIPDSLQFHLIKARLEAKNFKDAQSCVHHYETLLSKKTFRNETGARYGYALALLANKAPSEAQIQLKQLMSTHPNEPLFHLAFAQTLRDLETLKTARLYLEKALKAHPNNPHLILQLATYAILDGAPEEALILLKKHNTKRPKFKDHYKLIVDAYAKMQLPTKTHQAQAEYYVIEGNFREALKQLELAQAQGNLTKHQEQQILARTEELKKYLPN
ncbi:MAG TPA: M48 family metalloprotease [Gammaproteobacteria bacterium]|nr:M48 family metalloprotease [Gammaproteobacteria bacterium]